MSASTKDRFLACVAEHEMTVVSGAGVFRQITFKKPTSYNNHFHITTWPGYLAISGDAGCYVFARLPDMFKFFRGDGINPSYWGEKLQAVDRHGGYLEFSEECFREAIKSDFDQWHFDVDGDPEKEAEARKSAWEQIQESDLSEDETPESANDAIRRAMEYKCPISGNTFNDFWDHDLQDHTYRFLWCCHAIQWAIEKYDTAKPVAAADLSQEVA
jgi:hypothetical protein